MNLRRVSALLAFALHFALALSACAGTLDGPPDASASDGLLDAGYGGGGSVIPSFMADGATGTASYPYGSDGPTSSVPCPRDAAIDARANPADSDEASPEDAPSAPTCSAPLSTGDLVIDELMIASQSGSGDHGEWVEVASELDCAVDLKGLFVEVPHGKGTTLASVTTDIVLPPRGFFLVADSSDPALNHDLPGMLVVWGSGTSSDVLLNSGDTVTLYTSTVTVDTLTYPNPSKLVEGASMAFPSNCDPSLRTAFGNWQPAVASWSAGYFGTPAGPNTDVGCALAPPPTTTPCGTP